MRIGGNGALVQISSSVVVPSEAGLWLREEASVTALPQRRQSGDVWGTHLDFE
jgi:hypothetical protein